MGEATPDQTGVGLLVGAGLAAAVSITTAILAWQAKQDFDGTSIEAEAARLRDRHFLLATTAIATGVVAATAGTTAWWIWPEADIALTPDGTQSSFGLTFGTAW